MDLDARMGWIVQDGGEVARAENKKRKERKYFLRPPATSLTPFPTNCLTGDKCTESFTFSLIVLNTICTFFTRSLVFPLLIPKYYIDYFRFFWDVILFLFHFILLISLLTRYTRPIKAKQKPLLLGLFSNFTCFFSSVPSDLFFIALDNVSSDLFFGTEGVIASRFP